MKNATRKLLYITVSTLALSGCDFMQNHVGKYMPTIGEPCNNWQCFTSSGEAESDAHQHGYSSGSTGSGTGQSSARVPLNGSENPETAAPSAVAQPAPAAQHVTPFDMTPEELQEMPNPYGTSQE